MVLSTSNRDDDILQTYALGGNSFITKPPSLPGLVEVMRALDEHWFASSNSRRAADRAAA